MSNESYSRPRSHEEALHILDQGDAEALAGGTYLLGRRTRRAARLVDLDCLGLDYIKGNEAGVRCGSMTRLQELVESELLAGSSLGALAGAARATRPSLMLRNMSTVGGEVVERSRHSALAVALLALDAEVALATAGGERRLTLDEFYSADDRPPSVLLEIFIPAPEPSARAAFRRLALLPTQEAVAVAALSLSCDGPRVVRARAALGSSVRGARRLPLFERALMSKAAGVGEKDLRDCSRAGLEGVEFVGDYGGSVGYRREMSELLLTRMCLELLQDGTASGDGD